MLHNSSIEGSFPKRVMKKSSVVPTMDIHLIKFTDQVKLFIRNHNLSKIASPDLIHKYQIDELDYLSFYYAICNYQMFIFALEEYEFSRRKKYKVNKELRDICELRDIPIGDYFYFDFFERPIVSISKDFITIASDQRKIFNNPLRPPYDEPYPLKSRLKKPKLLKFLKVYHTLTIPGIMNRFFSNKYPNNICFTEYSLNKLNHLNAILASQIDSLNLLLIANEFVSKYPGKTEATKQKHKIKIDYKLKYHELPDKNTCIQIVDLDISPKIPRKYSSGEMEWNRMSPHITNPYSFDYDDLYSKGQIKRWSDSITPPSGSPRSGSQNI